MAFTNKWKTFKWSCKSNKMEQLKLFRYLSIDFHCRHTWASHHNSSKYIPNYILSNCLFFLYENEECFQMRKQIWCKALAQSIECVRASFLWRILGLPRCVLYSALGLEIGFIWLKTLAWLRKFSLGIFFLTLFLLD